MCCNSSTPQGTKPVHKPFSYFILSLTSLDYFAQRMAGFGVRSIEHLEPWQEGALCGTGCLFPIRQVGMARSSLYFWLCFSPFRFFFFSLFVVPSILFISPFFYSYSGTGPGGKGGGITVKES